MQELQSKAVDGSYKPVSQAIVSDLQSKDWTPGATDIRFVLFNVQNSRITYITILIYIYFITNALNTFRKSKFSIFHTGIISVCTFACDANYLKKVITSLFYSSKTLSIKMDQLCVQKVCVWAFLSLCSAGYLSLPAVITQASTMLCLAFRKAPAGPNDFHYQMGEFNLSCTAVRDE